MYETFATLETSRIFGLICNYQRDFHVAVNPHKYQDDPTVLPANSPYVVASDANGVVGVNYWSDSMQSLMAKTIPRIESLLDEAFARAVREDLPVKDVVLAESLAKDVALYLDMLMDGPPSNLGDILLKGHEMCWRLNL